MQERMARTPRRLSQASSKRKLIMLSPQRVRLQQVKNSPVRSAMKARMTVFKLSNTRRARRRKLTTRTAAYALESSSPVVSLTLPAEGRF